MTDPTRVEIDADGRGVLVTGKERWTFDLDLATGTAVLDPRTSGGDAIRVRPLRWREKLALARFARFDDAFIAHAVASACALPLSPDGPDEASLAALAAWLEDPATESAANRFDPAWLHQIEKGLAGNG